MVSNREQFFEKQVYAVVGNSKAASFPVLTYKGLKASGKTAYPVDPGVDEIEGDKTFKDLASIPATVDGVILEVPKEETRDWVGKAADIGVKDVWVHMQRETDEAITLAKERGINLRTGTCAVMYVTPGITFHSIHKWIMKLAGKY